MSSSALCPNSSQWRRLLLGEVAEDEASALEMHLEQCPACRLNVQALQAGDFELHGPAGSNPPGQMCERFREERAGAGDETIASELSSDGDTEFFGFMDPPQNSGELGRVGRFRILEVLGWGGMGVVFRAEGTGHDGPVALKVIRPSLALTASARQRFRREAEAAAALRHDHIVPVREVGEDRGLPYLVMPILRGETLEDRLQRDLKLSIEKVRDIGREIALGLGAAHDLGLIHHDIKPANIWLESISGRSMILDFGLVRVSDEHDSLWHVDIVAGTPAYMSPEQAQGDDVDERADLFSLGASMYRAVTGHAPFQGKNAAKILLAVVRDDPPPPMTVNPLVPAPLSNLIMCMLDKNPLNRPATARAVAATIATMSPTAPIAPIACPPARRWTLLGAIASRLRDRGKRE